MASIPKKELHSEDFPIEQKPDINGDRQPEIIRADSSLNKDYLSELSFNEEPVVIRLEPSAEKNAPTSIPIWVNGKGCEVLVNGKWLEFIYIPVGQIITVKRKYLAALLTAKLDTVETNFGKPGDENPQNKVSRFTSAYHSFSVIEDKNPKGAAWLSELRRRNM